MQREETLNKNIQLSIFPGVDMTPKAQATKAKVGKQNSKGNSTTEQNGTKYLQTIHPIRGYFQNI